MYSERLKNFGILGLTFAYTSGMLRPLVIISFLVLVPVTAICQVELMVPAPRFKVYDRIPAKVVNTGVRPISFAFRSGSGLLKDPGLKTSRASPIPFYVQQKLGSKWGTLLNGPDIGSYRSSEFLEQGQSLEFPFRLNTKGKMRLVLDYWLGRKM